MAPKRQYEKWVRELERQSLNSGRMHADGVAAMVQMQYPSWQFAKAYNVLNMVYGPMSERELEREAKLKWEECAKYAECNEYAVVGIMRAAFSAGEKTRFEYIAGRVARDPDYLRKMVMARGVEGEAAEFSAWRARAK